MSRPAGDAGGGRSRANVDTRYTLLECLGRGGGGVVYAAFDGELERRVAIKLLRADASGSTGGSDAQSRLIREARALARLAHPNVIHVYDVAPYEPGRLRQALPELAEQDEIPAEQGVFLVMELVEGSTLAEWRAGRAPTWREVLDIMIPAGRGLTAAHGQGLVHRDFKPQNVQIGDDGRVRVLDFGLARASVGDLSGSRSGSSEAGDPPDVDDGSVSLTTTGTVMGTPRYMSPEQHRGEQATEAADVYAFCVVLYEMLTGVVPFRGSSITELRKAKESGQIPDPPADVSIPRNLWRVVVRGLSPRPEDRYPSMAHVLAQIEAVPRARRRRWLAATATTVVLLGVVGGAFAYGEIREGRCEVGELELAGVWNDDVRQATRAALLATGVSYAETSWPRIEQAFDAYTTRWAELRRDVCRAGTIDESQSLVVTQWQTDCLQASLDAAAALAERLQHADAAVVQRAIEAVTSLPPLDRCTSVDVAESALARGDEERTWRRALERELAQIDAHVKMARFEPAAALAEAALERAQSRRLRDIEARVHIERSLIARGLGRHEEDEQYLHDAVAAAEEAGDDDVATRAYVALLFTVTNQAKHEEADRLAKQIAARLRRRGVEDELEAEYNRALGNLLRARGEFAPALAAFERTLAIREQQLSKDHPLIAQALSAVGAAHYNLAHFPKALELQQEALAVYRASLGDIHPRIGWTLQRIAHTTWRMGDPAEAVRHAERATEVLEASLGDDHPDVGDALGDLAALAQVAGDSERALELYDHVLAIDALEHGEDHPEHARKLGNYGLTLDATGRRKEAIEAFQRQLAIYENAFGRDHVDVAYPHQYLASAMLADGRPADALPHAERSAEIRQAVHGEAHPILAESLVTLGRVLAELDERTSARESFERALAIFDRLEGGQDQLGDAALGLARVLPASDSDRALELAQRAREAYERTENAAGLQLVDEWIGRRGAAR